LSRVKLFARIRVSSGVGGCDRPPARYVRGSFSDERNCAGRRVSSGGLSSRRESFEGSNLHLIVQQSRPPARAT